MNYNFLADKEDKLEILDFIFNETDLHVYDLSSSFGQKICRYQTVGEITPKFDLEFGDKFAITFQLWSPLHLGKPIFRKVELDSKRCNGHTFRYATDGLGLIQLYFGGMKNDELNQSHLGHFDQKKALQWNGEINKSDRVSSWDWLAIKETSSKLKSAISVICKK